MECVVSAVGKATIGKSGRACPLCPGVLNVNLINIGTSGLPPQCIPAGSLNSRAFTQRYWCGLLSAPPSFWRVFRPRFPWTARRTIDYGTPCSEIDGRVERAALPNRKTDQAAASPPVRDSAVFIPEQWTVCGGSPAVEKAPQARRALLRMVGVAAD